MSQVFEPILPETNLGVFTQVDETQHLSDPIASSDHSPDKTDKPKIKRKTKITNSLSFLLLFFF